VAPLERGVTDQIPTRWLTQMAGQLDDADRRLAGAERHLAAGSGGRALEEVYPGVMGAAMVKVWIGDAPWRRQRSLEEYQRMVRTELPSGFATLFEMKQGQRGFTGWRPEDAKPLLDEARDFVQAVRAELERCAAQPGR
jgi:hypothetical protein